MFTVRKLNRQDRVTAESLPEEFKNLIPDPDDLFKVITYLREQRDWDNLPPSDTRAIRIKNSLAALMYLTLEIDKAKAKGYL